MIERGGQTIPMMMIAILSIFPLRKQPKFSFFLNSKLQKVDSFGTGPRMT
jgi:hypothetical protein